MVLVKAKGVLAKSLEMEETWDYSTRLEVAASLLGTPLGQLQHLLRFLTPYPNPNPNSLQLQLPTKSSSFRKQPPLNLSPNPNPNPNRNSLQLQLPTQSSFRKQPPLSLSPNPNPDSLQLQSPTTTSSSIRKQPPLPVPAPVPARVSTPGGDVCTLFICAMDFTSRKLLFYSFDIVNDPNPPCCHSVPTITSQLEDDQVEDDQVEDQDQDQDLLVSSDENTDKNLIYSEDDDCPIPPPMFQFTDDLDLDPRPLYLHTLDKCYRGPLVPLSRSHQYGFPTCRWVVLDQVHGQGQGQLIYRLASSLDQSLDLAKMDSGLMCFEVATGRWHTRASMLCMRKVPHTWAIAGKICVLGGVAHSSDAWAELYDPQFDTWTPLPNPPNLVQYPPVNACIRDMFTARTVNPATGRMIILMGFLSTGEIYSLDVSSNFKWISLGQGHKLVDCPSTQITAVGFVLFWFSTELILCAYDIFQRAFAHSSPLSSLIEPQCEDDDEPYLGYISLLHIGGSRFCCVYIDRRFEPLSPKGPLDSKHRLHCVQFRATLANKSLKVRVESCQSYTIEGDNHFGATLVNHEVESKSILVPGGLNKIFDTDDAEAQPDLKGEELADA